MLILPQKGIILSQPEPTTLSQDPTSASRKQDHIELAFESVVHAAQSDTRFYYEPLLSAHPVTTAHPVTFLGKKMGLPLWVSSMTGGTELAGVINKNLARACAEFGMGMGLGSCRNLLYSDTYFEDFNLRPIIGPDLPFYANLGVAQVEELLAKGEASRIIDMVGKLAADGLIVHVNPLQEWLQPEGDRFQQAPLATIQALLEAVDFPVIVKEVGQGMGPESIKALLQLPIAALDFGALGGTNFARLELLRANKSEQQLFDAVAQIGHTAGEMTQFVNDILLQEKERIQCREVIISGGMRNFLDGYYWVNRIQTNAVYAQGSGFLAHARGEYSELRAYVEGQARGWSLAQAFLKVK
ncbi:MAG TPA: type 2 isopentenyl-diphosphate Delta-isomerase [Bacteroidetes bacterium]|jgi:isopentenyl-diphosphate Delta-isomerase|nr:MAG: isopentenyl-diphosphate delta-isomerase [Sphingobacteriales bacterium BACL12 MAG-120802-bin5]KRP12099.1 MAG: isopentenyl-diphosphate delta-isomerase [Sphingobacteriales bacterium BACL12 MAG-120813-bin55]HCK22841.1 type 2 isopentenyl-diphosphate Delta-isomerase [Bacteroidota bacterium]